MDQQRIDADYEKLYGRGINDVRQGMVFEKYKAIYFPIPKVACSSIKVFLTDFAEFSLDDLDKFKNYFKFAFVRNPWDRLVSCYINKIAEPQPPYCFPYWLDISFADFVRGISCSPDDGCDIHIKSQYLFLPDTLDFIGRFENLQEDMRKVAQIIGLPTVDLPHLVKTKHKHYSKYYDNETEQITRERYTRDIELFNYTFERSGYEGLLL